MDTTASNYTLAINENFPVTGHKNDSRGFQQNFANIKAALDAVDADVGNLQSGIMQQFQDTNVGSYNLLNANLINSNISVALPGDGSDPIDYSQFSLWPITLSEGGVNVILIENMPSGSSSGKLLVSVTPENLGMLISFTATTSTVVSIGPEAQPFDLPSLHPYLFEIWNDFTGIIPYTYVKKISREISVFNPNSDICSSDTFYGNSGIFNSVTIGSNTFTRSTSTITSNIGSIVIEGETYIGNIALAPNKITTTITGTDVAVMGGVANEIAVIDPSEIHPGAIVYFKGTNSQYTVVNVSANIVTVDKNYNVTYSNIGDTITFVNPIFSVGSTATQPTLMSFTDIPSIDDYGNISSGTTYNMQGSIYADLNNLHITFANPGNGPNTFRLSRATTFTNTVSDTIATVGLVNNFIPAGQIIMWYGSKFQIPYGWWLCDGSLAPNGIYTPDLRKKFIVGANSNYQASTTSNIIPSIQNIPNGPQILTGGTATSILIQHDHLSTASTYATHDPGHQHLAVGANTTSGSSPHPEGAFTNTNVNNSGNGPGGTQFWGFTEGADPTAVQWWTSPEQILLDKNPKNSGPQGSNGILFNTEVVVESTGTVGSNNHANLPPYTALYYIYKWLTVANANTGEFYIP